MSRTFQGRPVIPGNAEGEALVTHSGFNSLASFYASMLSGADRAVSSYQDNQELYGKDLTGRIVCLPQSIGSTSAGATWDCVAHMSIAPLAMLFSQNIDSLAAAGLVLAQIWAGTTIYAVDRLGDDFLNYVHEGDRIAIAGNGRVTVSRDIAETDDGGSRISVQTSLED
jgi:predicted aconitase with swiveling domain